MAAHRKESKRAASYRSRKKLGRVKPTLHQNQQAWAKTKARVQAKEREAVSSKKFFCSVCQIACPTAARLQHHNATARHKKKADEASSGVAYNFHCQSCNFSCNELSDYERHTDSKRHIQKTTC